MKVCFFRSRIFGHTHHSFEGFQRLNEAAWFMDDGFAHPFIVSWSNAKNCEMREQCIVCNWEKNTWYKRGKRGRWNQPFSFTMTDASRLHMISSELFSAPAPNLYQKHSGIPGVAKKSEDLIHSSYAGPHGFPSKSANFLWNSLLGTHPGTAQSLRLAENLWRSVGKKHAKQHICDAFAKTMPGVTGTLLSNPAGGLDQNWKNSVVDGSMIEPKCMDFWWFFPHVHWK